MFLPTLKSMKTQKSCTIIYQWKLLIPKWSILEDDWWKFKPKSQCHNAAAFPAGSKAFNFKWLLPSLVILPAGTAIRLSQTNLQQKYCYLKLRPWFYIINIERQQTVTITKIQTETWPEEYVQSAPVSQSRTMKATCLYLMSGSQ